jgi:hypothetical protein
MATRRTSFGKLQRDRAKQANQAAKRERRLERANAEPDAIEIPEEGELSAEQLLELIEQIHKQFEANEIDFEEFEEKKLELMARLPVD